MRHRLQALLGSIAHAIRVTAASLLSLVGLGELARFVVPLLVVALGAAAVTSARDTIAILESRPEVTESTVREVARFQGDPDASVWFAVDGLVDSSHLETAADLGTFFYLARDPEEPSAGIIVRSSLNDAHLRQRVVGATLVEDPDYVASALEQLGPLPASLDVETNRYLVELEAGGNPEQAFLPSELGEEPAGSEVLVAGRVVSPGDYAAEGDDGTWLYLFADAQGGTATVLRSPHPPSAIPMRLEGLFLRDSFDLADVVASDWYAGLDAEVPTDRSLAAGQRPPITVPASWVPTIAFALLGLLLLASWLARYPVFRNGPEPVAARTLPIGGAIDAAITGRLARDRRALRLDRSPGAVERLAIAELALRMWRYGLLPQGQSRREAEERFVAEAAGETDRLVVHERDQSALVVVDGNAVDGRVRSGRLYRVGGSAPAVHFRQAPSDVYLETRSEAERDRAAAEIAAEARGG